MSRPSHYTLLGVPLDADAEEIRAAYRRKAAQDHPDRTPEDPAAAERFRALVEARDVLCDPEARAKYDARLRAPATPKGPRKSSPLSAVWRAVTGRPGADLRVRLALSLREMAEGCKRTVGVDRARECDRCRGAGCGACGGRGSIRVRGRVEVDVPGGVTVGTRLRLEGEGDGGLGGAHAGDLIVVVEAEPNPLLRIEGRNLVAVVPISLADLIEGARVEVPCLEGKMILEVTPGLDPASPHIEPGRGLPDQQGQRGSLEIRWRLDILTQPTSRQLELARAWRTEEERAPSALKTRYVADMSRWGNVDG